MFVDMNVVFPSQGKPSRPVPSEREAEQAANSSLMRMIHIMR